MEAEPWVLIVVGVLVAIAIVLVVGNYIHERISPKAEEYRRAQVALEMYEEQQRTYREHEERAARQMARQDALLDRIENLVYRWEQRLRDDPSGGAGIQRKGL